MDNMDENKVVRYRLAVFGKHFIKALDHIIFTTHNVYFYPSALFAFLSKDKNVHCLLSMV